MNASLSWLGWDLLALLILILLVWDCARKGFMRKILGFLGAVASAAGAAFLSGPVALWLYDVLVRDAIRATLSRRIARSLEGGFTATESLLSAVPGWAARMASGNTDLPLPAAMDQVLPAVEELIDAVLVQPVLMLLRGLCFFVLFTLFSLIAKHLARMFSGINGVPLIGPVNTVLGGALGVGQALVILYLMAVVGHIYVAYSGGGTGPFTDYAMGEGFLFGFFYRMTA